MIRRPPRSTLSLHDALPISVVAPLAALAQGIAPSRALLLDPTNPEWTRPAPAVSHIRFETTKGVFVLEDRKSTRLNSSHSQISYAVFCLKKKNSFQRHELHD